MKCVIRDSSASLIMTTPPSKLRFATSPINMGGMGKCKFATCNVNNTSDFAPLNTTEKYVTLSERSGLVTI